jgi:hypothetical protein
LAAPPWDQVTISGATPESRQVVDLVTQSRADVVLVRLAPETLAQLTSGAAVQRATDAVFANNQQAHPLAPLARGEVEGLGLELALLLSM